jgi:hypothetical protein
MTFAPNSSVTDRPEDRQNLPVDSPGPSGTMSQNECRQTARNRSALMNTFQLAALSLIFSVSVLGIQAQDTPSANAGSLGGHQYRAMAALPSRIVDEVEAAALSGLE